MTRRDRCILWGTLLILAALLSYHCHDTAPDLALVVGLR